ncbi:hypothetical protein GCM10022284_38990 [Streptomyces hundungensis]
MPLPVLVFHISEACMESRYHCFGATASAKACGARPADATVQKLRATHTEAARRRACVPVAEMSLPPGLIRGFIGAVFLVGA